jgi:hypothetical protein
VDRDAELIGDSCSLWERFVQHEVDNVIGYQRIEIEEYHVRTPLCTSSPHYHEVEMVSSALGIARSECMRDI